MNAASVVCESDISKIAHCPMHTSEKECSKARMEIERHFRVLCAGIF